MVFVFLFHDGKTILTKRSPGKGKGDPLLVRPHAIPDSKGGSLAPDCPRKLVAGRRPLHCTPALRCTELRLLWGLETTSLRIRWSYLHYHPHSGSSVYRLS